MTYNITDFGAYSSDRLMTGAIQAAIDTCFRAGGGEVVIPEGIFRTGSILLRSHVTLHLLSGAVLEGSEDPADYFGWREDKVEPREGLPADPYHVEKRSSTPFSAWSNGLIRIIDAADVAVIGEKYSFIDGRNVYDPNGEENYRGPHGISVWNVDGLTLRGYTIRNTGNWAHAIFKSKNISMKKVTVYGGHDGFDVFLCRKVRVEDCRFFTGDDCIAGFGSVNVTVKNSVLHSSCSAIRFGGTHVTVENCETAAPAEFGFRGSLSPEEKASGRMPTAAARHNTKTAFLYYCDDRFGALENKPGKILIKNCTFHNVDQLFNMDFGRHKWCSNAPLTSICFKNCTLTGMTLPIYIHGDPADPIDFVLDKVSLSAAEGHEDMPLGDIEGYKVFRAEDVVIERFTSPTLLNRGEGKIITKNTTDIALEAALPGESELKGH